MDPISIVAAAFGVTDVGVRTSIAIGSLIHDWTTSNSQIAALQEETTDIKASIAEVRQFCDSTTRQGNQQSVLQDLENRCKRTEKLLLELDEIIKALRVTPSGALSTRAKARWVRKKSSIKDTLSRLYRSRASVIELYRDLSSKSYQREVTDGHEQITSLVTQSHEKQIAVSEQIMRNTQEIRDGLRLLSEARADTGSTHSSAVSAVSRYVVDSLIEDGDATKTLPTSADSSTTYSLSKSPHRSGASSTQNDYNHLIHMRRIRRGSACNDHCRCACHEKHTTAVKSAPLWFQSLFGSVFVAVYQLPRNQCNFHPCKSNGSKVYVVRWTLPFWLPRRQLEALLCAGSPTYEIRLLDIRRRVGFFDENSLLRLAWSGDADTTQFLLDSKLASCDDMETHNGRTALEMAIDGRKLNVIKVLLKKGARLDVESDNRKSPGDYAAELILTRNAPTKLLQYLEKEVEVKLGDYTPEWALNALHKIVIFSPETLRDELADRPDLRKLVNEKDRTGRTPLHWAALMGDEDAISVLMMARADLNARDESAATPLHEAARSNNPRALQMLMTARPDCQATNKLGQMAIHIVALRADEKHEEFLSPFVLGMHSLEEPSTYSRTTPFGYAAMADKVEMMTHLVKLGASMSTPDEDGDIPLFEAINFGSCNAIRFLLDPSRREQAGYRHRNNSGHNLLHKAARRANTTVVRVLAEYVLHGLNPDGLDLSGKSPRDLLSKRARNGLLQDGLEDAFEKLLKNVRDAKKEHSVVAADTPGEKHVYETDDDEILEEKLLRAERSTKFVVRSRWNPLGWFM